jgi:hypothetical protein
MTPRMLASIDASTSTCSISSAEELIAAPVQFNVVAK